MKNKEESISDEDNFQKTSSKKRDQINEDFDDEIFLQKLWNAIYEFFELLQ